MAEKSESRNTGSSVEGSLRGFLTRLGDRFDSFTGRSWKPPGGLTTSRLTEQLKELVDSRVRDLGKKGSLAPNILRIKIDWQKFSAESDSLISKLEEDILVALIDHYNDRRYHTADPISLKIKTDYFTDGVTLSATFPSESVADNEIELEMPIELKEDVVTTESDQRRVPAVKISDAGMFRLLIRYVSAGNIEATFDFPTRRRISIGRTDSNDVVIADQSVSSAHASAMMNADGGLLIADLGSRNGTFIDGERLEEGVGVVIESGTKVKFGNVSVVFEFNRGKTSVGGAS